MKENRISILFIIPSLRPGGAERITSILCEKLNKKKFDVNLLILNSINSFYKLPDESDVNIINLNLKNVRYSILKINKIIKAVKPEIIFSSITHLNSYVGLFKPLFFSKIKLVFRETNVLNSLITNRSKFNIYNLVQKLAYKNANTIICQSEFMKSEINELFGIKNEKLIVINNPVKVELIEDKKKVKYDLIAVGRFSEIKGYHRMMKIMTLVNKNIKLTIIGDGEERLKIETLIQKYGLNNRVKLLGVKKNPINYMKRAKLLVLTSYFESFPNVVLEAGSVGLPVISFDMPGGIREIIVNNFNGVIVKDGDVNSMAKIINEYMFFDFDRKNIIEYTKRKFEVDTIIKKYEKVYFDLVKSVSN